jgi:hypothetical protein
MDEMEMERALAKLKLGPKKDPNELLNKILSIKCRYLLELSESKKKVQVLRLQGTQYSSIIATTTMIHCEKIATLTTEKLLEEMHLQWHLSGGKLKDDKNSNDGDEIALAAANAKKGGRNPVEETNHAGRTPTKIRPAVIARKRDTSKAHVGPSIRTRSLSP